MRKVHKKKNNNNMMTAKKGIIGLLLVVCCFVSTMFYVFADTTPTISISKIDSASRQEEITFTVKLTNDKEYTGINFAINYDPDDLEYVSSNLATASGDTSYDLRVATPANDPGKVSWTFGFMSGSANTDNDLGTITFKVKDTASGNSDITLSDVVMTDADLKEFSANGENGSVFVSVPVESSSLEEEKLEIEVGETDNINVIYSPSDTTDSKEFTYVSNNKDVVTVDSTGKVTAVGVGSTTITVTAFGNTYTQNVEVVSHIKSIELDKEELTLNKGESYTYTVTINPSDTTDDKTITWESDDEDVATVDSNGKVTAVGVGDGSATITATSSNGKVATSIVKVQVPMDSATISDTDVTLEREQTKQLSVTILPEDTTEDKTITWDSDNKTVATVDNTGLVTAVGGGTANITAKVGGFTLNTVVSVYVPIDKIELNDDYIELLPTQEQQLSVTITPTDTTVDKTVSWESSVPTVASVDDTGKVKALTNGTTVITATVGELDVSCTVKVLIPIDSFVVSSSELNMKKGDVHTLTVTILPDNAEESKTVEWSSNKEDVATVDSTGKVTAVGGGSATITGTLKNGKTVTTTVNVTVPITSVEINKDSLELERSQTANLSVTINPSDTSEDKTVSWSSNNKDVATVDSTGKVTAVGPGNAVITATVGSFTVTCSVEVIIPITSVVINSDDLSLDIGNSANLTATVNPSDTTESKTIYWSSNDDNIVSVDQNGTIVAKGRGTATITAKAGTKTDTINVTVNIPIVSFTIENAKEEVLRNKTITLKTTINPSDTTEDKTITWESDDPSIASVDANGVVTGKKEGVVTITGTLENGMSVECEVTVNIIPVDSVSMSQEKVEMLKGKNHKISLVIDPIDATEVEDIIWTSSDPEIATVDSEGNIKAVSAGTVTITAKMGNYEAECEVVVEEIPLESIEVVNTKNTIEIGQTFKLNINLNPMDTTDEIDLKFESSDPSIIKVDAEGNVTGVKVGKATITVIANGIETTYDITVKDIVSPKTGIGSIVTYIVIAIVSLVGVVFMIRKKVNV